jgi:hypothetical protein
MDNGGQLTTRTVEQQLREILDRNRSLMSAVLGAATR